MSGLACREPITTKLLTLESKFGYFADDKLIKFIFWIFLLSNDSLKKTIIKIEIFIDFKPQI